MESPSLVITDCPSFETSATPSGSHTPFSLFIEIMTRGSPAGRWFKFGRESLALRWAKWVVEGSIAQTCFGTANSGGGSVEYWTSIFLMETLGAESNSGERLGS